MYTLLIVLLVIDCVILAAAVLLQAPKGGGLAATFGGAGSSPDAFIGTRQAANLLTKTTWWTAGIFLVLAYLLQLMGQRASAPKSVLDEPFTQQAAPTAPAPTNAAPAVPLQPAAPATTPPSTTPAPKPKP